MLFRSGMMLIYPQLHLFAHYYICRESRVKVQQRNLLQAVATSKGLEVEYILLIRGTALAGRAPLLFVYEALERTMGSVFGGVAKGRRRIAEEW